MTEQTLLNGLGAIGKLKKIPNFNLPRTLEFELGGFPATIRRANAEDSIPAMTLVGRLMSDILGHVLSHSDEHAPEAKGKKGKKLKKGGGSMLSQLMGEGNMSLSEIKTYIATKALPELANLKPESGPEFYAVFRLIVPDYLTVDGVLIESMEEFDEMGATSMHMLEIFWKALEVNFYPTTGAPDIDVGSERPSDPPRVPKVAPTKETRKKKKSGAATRKGGQSGRMSRRVG